MANITEPLVHGFINSTHTSTIAPVYPPRNLPTPWPLVAASLVVSLTISCYGVKSAFTPINADARARRGRQQGVWRRIREAAVREAELATLRNGSSVVAAPKYESRSSNTEFESEQSSYPEDQPPSYEELEPQPVQEAPASPPVERTSTSLRKITLITISGFCCFRAVVALIVNLQALFDNKTTLSAPSNLFLVLISIQIISSNHDHSLPRLIKSILAASTVAISIAFLIASYFPLINYGDFPRYGFLDRVGGTCPVYASNCVSQTTHWDEVGCGNYTTYENFDNDAYETPDSKFYHPYISNGNINAGTSMNPLHVMETVVFVFGTIWLFTVIWEVREAINLFGPTRPDNSASPPGFAQNKHQRNPQAITVMILIFGIGGGFVAALMSLGGHMSQALGTHHSTWIDSIGPLVPTNGTFDNYGNIITSDYWGNSTSWNDCFTITAPKSGNGFWSKWVAQNSNTIYRIAAGL